LNPSGAKQGGGAVKLQAGIQSELHYETENFAMQPSLSRGHASIDRVWWVFIEA
jgi:hypothetical protein